jgi:hypothetical protein
VPAAATNSLPRFHYEVHRVPHKFGHHTPPEQKLRDVNNLAAAAASAAHDDSSDADDVLAAAAEHHLKPTELEQQPLSDVPQNKEAQRHDETSDDVASWNADSDVDGPYEDTDSKRVAPDGEDSIQPLYAHVSSDSNTAPSYISDVYFIGKDQQLFHSRTSACGRVTSCE